jgi:hypothetical protein
VGVPVEIGVLFTPCVFFLLKYRQITFSSNLPKQEKNKPEIYFIRKKLPKNVVL